jgi:hypothetical protein
MPSVLTKSEIFAVLEVGGSLAGKSELPDPFAWADLRALPVASTRVIQARLRDGRTPSRGQVFPWPKEKGGSRPMAWLDPFDQMIYRGTVGRLESPAMASIDRTSDWD